jgi:hypothetical protein
MSNRDQWIERWADELFGRFTIFAFREMDGIQLRKRLSELVREVRGILAKAYDETQPLGSPPNGPLTPAPRVS